MKKIFSIISFFIFVTIVNGEIWVKYKGLDNTHLEFYDWENFPANIKLKVSETGEILFQQTLPQGGGTVSGKIKHSGLSEGTYTYQLWADGLLRSSVQVQINKKIYGELLFDETISETAFLENNLTVPIGKTLNVNGNLARDHWINNNVYVNGVINFQSGISLQDVNIHLQGGVVNVSGIEGNGCLNFYSNSSGSNVENCKGFLTIIVKENTSLSIKNSEIDGLQIAENGTSVSINNTFISGSVSFTKLQNFEAKNTTFLSQVGIAGGSPKFEDCEFANSVNLNYRNSCEFKNCVFGCTITFYDPEEATDIPKWSEDSSIKPTFSGCSFTGRQGPFFNYPTMPYSPIDLGNTNYYGDKNPVFVSETYWYGSGPICGWFLTRGVPIDINHFKIEKWSNSGPQMKNEKVLPSFWLNDYVIGQNCISHLPGPFGVRKEPVLIQGRETLLSLDIATNYPSISGVKFKAIFDGQEIQPENPNLVLRRDISVSPNDVFYGNTTVNFILPPTNNSSVNLKIIMDLKGISGFNDVPEFLKGENTILDINLTFSPEYDRKLNIVVQPVQLYITGYTRKTPDGKSVENSLKKLIPAMLPISKEQLHIWTAAPTTFYGGILSMLSTTALLNRIANYLSIGQGFLNTTASIGDWLTGKEGVRIDFVIAVLPNGVLGTGASGANLKLRRGIIFVDENFPASALHEIGHAIGLYTWKEQYDQYPPAGLPVEGLTAFINEKSYANSFTGFRNRYLHFPKKGQSWYEDKYWFDIMGSTLDLIWPIESTFLSFRSYFKSNLGEKTKSIKYVSGKVPENYKRIFISGKTQKIESAVYYYELTPGTISAFEITDFSTGKMDVFSEMYYWPSDDYKLECFDNSGNNIYTQEFTIVSPYKDYVDVTEWPSESSFCGTFDIPKDTKVIKIFHRLWWDIWEENPVFEVTYSELEPIKIISPIAGTELSESVEISWKNDETKQRELMSYVIMVSTDGGNSWVPIGAPIQANKIIIPTDFLSCSDNIIFKVIGSNGLGNIEAEVGGLKVGNRPPKAIIVKPKDGWIGTTTTKWELIGYGIDNEDGIIEGIWESDKDGQLDPKIDVILSQGIHTLTFKVEDSGGLIDTESIQVEVKEEITEIDIGLEEESLSLYIEGKDPLNTSKINWLKEGGIHRAILKIQNTGIETTFKSSLYLKKPNSTEELLISKEINARPFEEVVISETFIVEEQGEYRIKGEITEISPNDTNNSNNQKVWIYRTKPNQPIIEALPEELDFGQARVKKEGYILIKNHGNSDLIINSLTITGQNSNEFTVDKSIINLPIPSENSILIPVYFNPNTKGEKQVILIITSNDPENSSITINLKGTCIILLGDISNDGLVDISDVILCLRMAIGLSEPNLNLADMNEDGEVDITDVIKILRKAIGLD